MTVSNLSDDAALRGRLSGMTSATATAMLNVRGYQNQYMAGAVPIQTGGRACGRAVTVRFGPARPDMMLSPDQRHQEALWLAIESLVPGDFLVLDCGGDVRAGTTGDILTARVKRRGGVGIVVDGALRDAAQIRDLVGLPCWSRGVHGSGFTAALVCLDLGLPVRCFGVTVRPGDYILADDDGLVAVPAALAAEVAADGGETELKETFIRGLVEQGLPIADCYPPTAAVLEQFHTWKHEHGY
ncbi:MAG: ribonuclease activity regulator RraA [Chloroflexi bacterium]|nr:ribonuclease activity regulator RraA [Chloroflexota bacterium]